MEFLAFLQLAGTHAGGWGVETRSTSNAKSAKLLKKINGLKMLLGLDSLSKLKSKLLSDSARQQKHLQPLRIHLGQLGALGYLLM
ncbi:hypothetical protein FRC08_011993 [Ceratobasidium sp. 394]|nr:hypothetical protein FRC08_011993 [Ceratobasidium sp. 394]